MENINSDNNTLHMNEQVNEGAAYWHGEWLAMNKQYDNACQRIRNIESGEQYTDAPQRIIDRVRADLEATKALARDYAKDLSAIIKARDTAHNERDELRQVVESLRADLEGTTKGYKEVIEERNRLHAELRAKDTVIAELKDELAKAHLADITRKSADEVRQSDVLYRAQELQIKHLKGGIKDLNTELLAKQIIIDNIKAALS